jgi:lysine 6-dehydrogenase
MRMLILGAGLQGCAVAFDLLETTQATVTLADYAIAGLPEVLKPHAGKRLTVIQLDVRDEARVLEVMKGHDAVLSAIPYYFNFDLARMAVEAKVHFADLGGNTDIVRRQETLDARAREQGVSVLPDCGLAPGMVNILAAEGIRRLDQADAVRLYVGGLPLHPQPPLNYQIVYSLEGALDYYTTPSWVVRDSKVTQVEALSEIESVEFPAPLGALEAFHTGGGVSTMPWALAGNVRTVEYKTLRYPGHARIMWAIRELGLLDLKPVSVKGNAMVPRDAFIATVDSKLRKPDAPDLVALKVVVSGKRKGAPATATFQVIDHADLKHKMSAMMRTTGYSLSITGQMQVAGTVGGPGVRTAYEGTPYGAYVDALRKRGIVVEEAAG